MNARRITIALLLLTLVAAPAAAVITQQTYQINAGGTYQYKLPSSISGIPGGMPSDHQLDFGIGGTFVYELDTAGPTARLLNLNLFLTGNESVQAAPPPLWATVTADRVETFLADQVFVEDVIGGLLHLKSLTASGLKLTDGLNGSLSITGGYDLTNLSFNDGDGIQFQFGAVAVPEPAGAALLATAALALRRRRPGLTAGAKQ